MAHKVVGSSVNREGNLSVVQAATELTQLAGRVEAVLPPAFLAQSLLSGLPSFPLLSVSADPLVEGDGLDREGPRGAAAAAAKVFAPRVETSSSSSQVQSNWEGIPNNFKSQLITLVRDIENLSIEQATALDSDSPESKQLIKILPDKKRNLAKRLKSYYKDVIKYIGRDVVLDLVIKFIVKFNVITIKQKQTSVGGRSPKLFHKYEAFEGWIDAIKKKLNPEQLNKLMKEAVEPFSNASIDRDSLIQSMVSVKKNFVDLLKKGEAYTVTRKHINTVKVLFVQRANALVERLEPYSDDPEIITLAKEIKKAIVDLTNWQAITQNPNSTGISRGIKSFSNQCPGLDAFLGSKDSSVQLEVLPDAQVTNEMSDRMEGAVIHLESFKKGKEKWLAMDKKALAEKNHKSTVKALALEGRNAKQTFVRNGLLGRYLKSKDGSSNPAEEAPLAENLAKAFNEISMFQSRCPDAKNILCFRDTFPEYAESLRSYLSEDSAVFAPSPAGGPKSKRGAAPFTQVLAPVPESSESSSSSSDSSSESSESSSERAVITNPRRNPTRLAGLKRTLDAAREAEQLKKPRLAEKPSSLSSMDLVEAAPIPESQTLQELSPSIAPPILTLEQRHKNLLAKLKEEKRLIPGFSVKSFKTEEELVIDPLDFYELHFKKTPSEKVTIITAHVEKLKILLGQVWRSNETMRQKRAFICQIAEAFNFVISRITSSEFGEFKNCMAEFAETINSLFIDDAELFSLFGNKSFFMLFPSFANYCIKNGDEALLRRILSKYEARLLSL